MESTAIGQKEAAEPLPTLMPAAYGRACVGCVKAKCKCLTRGSRGRCERQVILFRWLRLLSHTNSTPDVTD